MKRPISSSMRSAAPTPTSPRTFESALKTTTMPSLLGGTYKMDDHNHPHTPMQIIGVRGGKASVIAQVGG